LTPAAVRTVVPHSRMKPIRVLFISHDSSMFGAQRTLLTLLSDIDRDIFSPMLVVPYDGPLSRAASELGIPVFVRRLVHWIPGLNGTSARKRLGHLYRVLRTLSSRCRALESLIGEHDVGVHANRISGTSMSASGETATSSRCFRTGSIALQ
jgi:hypothetical protein